MSSIKEKFVKCLFKFYIGRKGFLSIFGIICGLMINVITIPFYKRSCDKGVMLQMSESMRGRYMPQIGGLQLYQDEYEPRIVTRDPEEVAQKMAEQKPVIRPRFYSTELGIKDKLFIAVITNSSVLRDFGKPFNKTVAHHVDKLLFFVDLNSGPISNTSRDLPIVSFPDKKFKSYQFVFVVIDYLTRNYANMYDFFLLVDGRNSIPYVNGRALHRTLSHVSVSHSLHLGVPVKTGSHFCALEKGIVLSTAVLTSISSSSHWCMMHASMTVSVDANLARCTLHATALPCSTTVQEKVYKSYTFSSSIGSGSRDVYKALDSFGITNDETTLPFTITGIKKNIHIFASHHYLLAKEIKILQGKLNTTREEILKVRPNANLNPLEETWPVGSPTPHHPSSRYDVISWTAFNATHVFMPDEHSNIALLGDALLRDITSVVLAGASHVANKSEGRLLLQGLNYGYYRVDPLRGTDYVLSLQFRDANMGSLTDKIIEATRSVTVPEYLYMPFNPVKTIISMVVRVPELELKTGVEFVNKFVKTRGLSGNSTLLMVVERNPLNHASTDAAYKRLVDACAKAAITTKTSVRAVTIPPSPVFVSTGVSLVNFMDKVVPLISETSLVAVIPVDATMSAEGVDRIRINTIAGWQIFSPIVWGLFHPQTQSSEKDAWYYKTMYVKANIGQFQRFDFTTISFYAKDYIAARKNSSKLFPPNVVPPRGSPTLSIYRLFLSFSNLHVLRAPEPHIKLPYLPVKCPPHVNVSAPVTVDKTSFSTPNELSDISLLMGETQDLNNNAFYRYVYKHYLAEDKPGGVKPINWSLKDFNSDEFCVEHLLHSFGTRSQLGKLTIEYDDDDKVKPLQ